MGKYVVSAETAKVIFGALKHLCRSYELAMRAAREANQRGGGGR